MASFHFGTELARADKFEINARHYASVDRGKQSCSQNPTKTNATQAYFFNEWTTIESALNEILRGLNPFGWEKALSDSFKFSM